MKRILLIHTFGGKMRNETWITENNTLMMLSFADNQWTQINPSCLLAYLGIRGYGINAKTTEEDITVQKMAVPLLGYYDIFKNRNQI